MATVKFPSEMPAAGNVGGNDKLMISKDGSGEAFQVSFNAVKEYLEITDIELSPVQGGATEAEATPLPSAPAGQNRKMDASPGWYSVGGVPVEATSGHVWKWFWNGTSWGLVDMGELPQVEGTDVLNPQGEGIPKEKATADYVKSNFVSGETLGLSMFNIGDNIAPELSNSDVNDPLAWVKDSYLNSSGASVAYTGMMHTVKYYPIVAGDYLCNIQLNNTPPMAIVLYDNDYNVVQSITSQQNTDWNFTANQDGYIRFSKRQDQASELDYCKTLQSYNTELTDDVVITRSYADNILETKAHASSTYATKTELTNVSSKIQPKFFANATRDIDYRFLLDLRLTSGDENQLKDANGDWLELFITYMRFAGLESVPTTIVQIAKRNPDTGEVGQNNIAVASSSISENLVDENGYAKIDIPEANGSGLTFTVLIDTNKLILGTDTRTNLGDTLQLNTRYLFEQKQVGGNTPTPSNKNIVMLGDSITDLGSIPSLITSKTGWSTVQAGFAGCRMGSRNTSATNGAYYNEMSFFRVANYIASGNFDGLMQAAVDLQAAGGPNKVPVVNRLINTDWNTVDYIIVGYGTNDYGATTSAGGVGIGLDTDILADGSTFKGAMNYGIQQLQEAYPHIQIIFWTPIFRSRYATVGDGNDSDTYANDRGLYLSDYVDAIIDIANLNHVEHFDLNRKSGINKYTADYYLADGLHPNEIGDELMADRLIGKIKSLF